MYRTLTFCFALFALADPPAVADVQEESSVLAVSCFRDVWRVQPETSGKYQEEEAQITQRYCCLAHTSFNLKYFAPHY